MGVMKNESIFEGGAGVLKRRMNISNLAATVDNHEKDKIITLSTFQPL